MPKNFVATSVPTTQKELMPARKRSEYVLLNRVLDRCDESEQQFIRGFLEDCLKSGFTPQEVALNNAAHHFRLGIHTEYLDRDSDFAKIIRSLPDLFHTSEWLFRFFSQVAYRLEMNPEEKITTDVAADTLAMKIDEVEIEIESVRDVLRQRPEALAEDIQKAAAKLTAGASNAQ